MLFPVCDIANCLFLSRQFYTKASLYFSVKFSMLYISKRLKAGCVNVGVSKGNRLFSLPISVNMKLKLVINDYIARVVKAAESLEKAYYEMSS